MKLPTLSHLLKIYKFYVAACLILIFLTTLFVGGFQFWALKFSPTFPVLDVQVSNLTDRSVTLSWVTTTPMVGVVRFLGEKNLTREANRTESKIHVVTISGLQPRKAYYIYVTNYYGRKISTVPFMTLPTPMTVKLPQTVYGKVISDGQPSVDSLVLLRRIFLTTPQVSSETISTTTNTSGNFLLDLSNAFLVGETSADSSYERLEIKVWDRNGKFKESLMTTIQTQPVPNIEL